MKPEITVVEMPARKLVGLETKFICALHEDANGMEIIGPFWGEAAPRVFPHQGPDTSQSFGLTYFEPEAERAHPGEAVYMVAVEHDGPTPDGLVSREIPAGMYAVFTHHGPMPSFPDEIKYAMNEWLPASEWEHSGQADLEMYDERFLPQDPENSAFEYWFSVKKR